MTHPAALLQKSPIFAHLPVAECTRLAQNAVTRNLVLGEYLCHQGDQWPYAILLLSGQLRWAILAVSGREHVLYHVEAEGMFWGHSLFDNEPMPASLSATKPSQLFMWSRENLMPILFKHPKAMWELACQQVHTMRRAREIIYGLAFKPVAGRLARLLLDRAPGTEVTTMQRDLTLSDIAAMVASSQEVICRLLYQFQADGILEISRASITLTDREALEQLTAED